MSDSTVIGGKSVCNDVCSWRLFNHFCTDLQPSNPNFNWTPLIVSRGMERFPYAIWTCAVMVFPHWSDTRYTLWGLVTLWCLMYRGVGYVTVLVRVNVWCLECLCPLNASLSPLRVAYVHTDVWYLIKILWYLFAWRLNGLCHLDLQTFLQKNHEVNMNPATLRQAYRLWF